MTLRGSVLQHACIVSQLFQSSDLWQDHFVRPPLDVPNVLRLTAVIPFVAQGQATAYYEPKEKSARRFIDLVLAAQIKELIEMQAALGIRYIWP